ncbi:hypothetical protein MRX96_030252 [Rhipicephalus microplus]
MLELIRKAWFTKHPVAPRLSQPRTMAAACKVGESDAAATLGVPAVASAIESARADQQGVESALTPARAQCTVE